MTRWIVHLETGYCGEDAWETYLNSFIDHTELNEMALENARMYDHSTEYEDEDEYDEEEDINERIEYSIEEYNPTQHDMHRGGGGSFEDDFKGL